MKSGLYISVLLALVLALPVDGQQVPVTSQYLTNGLVINPAYAGTREVLSANLSYRKQWARINGAPQFQTLSLHSPVNKKERVSLGLMTDYLTYGVTKDVGIYGFYAYSIRYGHGKLSMGLKAGFDLSNTNYNRLRFPDGNPADPLLSGDMKYSLPNMGVGFYYYTEKYFVGLSVPSLLTYKRDEADQFSVTPDYSLFRTYLTAGTLVRVADMFKVKPSVLIRYSMHEPLEVDLNANLIFADMLWFGCSFRIAEKAAVALLDLQVTPQLKVGYSFDYQLGHLNNYTSGTHEVSLRYEFAFAVTATSPRYF
ncbi:MAG TPA: type IX secretion system membrane protein PorP/SprF [Bacteroidales bacterium]|jgi:type IX secretion system PorP/SprF family membrane protein|nr:type IX secretion system membrane protein PorP/SprF [Bacteroidales bacterium]MBP7036778.1 type IX secretion system membrane protein PorP/SprF [Bacteroidales bacterium]MBP8709834.1 type IX secretion system membrane protein PorP/SprF [Bacteroidales bacterium]HHV00050.1 type IX secretion system membrane protein PorP/SprF [Bacteroidales bacterium]HNV66093.1 type IX secretion system membrane protein PorP/SprF [Bacteroidales bacterium]